MAALDTEIAAFDRMREDLEKKHMGDWVLVHEESLVGAYNSFNNAVVEAMRKFGRGPYLIRQVGASLASLPASVLYRPENGNS